MASVQVTDSLIDRTLYTLSRFDKMERTRFNREFNQSLSMNGDDILQRLLGPEFTAWAAKAPIGMFNTADILHIEKVGGKPVGIDLPLIREAVLPHMSVSCTGGGSMSAGFKKLFVNLDHEHPNWEPMLAAVDKLCKRRCKRDDEHRELHLFVKQLLKSWASLGPALKAWPPLWDLLNTEDRRRIGARPKGMAFSLPTQDMRDRAPAMASIVMRMRMAGGC